MSKPRILDSPPTALHVISSLGRLGGGAERQLLLYFQHRTDQWRHVLTYRRPHELLREEIEKTGVATVSLGHGGFIRQLMSLLRVARVEHADFVHTHLSDANALGRLTGLILRLPVITTLTSTPGVEDRVASRAYDEPWKYRLGLWFEKVTACWTSRFIAISETVKDSAVRTMGIAEPRVRVVYRAVQIGALNGSRPPTSAPTLITTGRIVPNKGQDLLIRMIPMILKEWPDCTLQVVGEGKSRKELERLAADLDVASHVQFLGLRSDVNQLLGRADLYVFASWYEGFANAFAEAIAGGLPVVAVDLPVFREIAPSSSVILVQRDERAFADAVIQVLRDLERFRRAAREESVRFRERFSIQRYVRETEALYAEAAGRVS